MRCVMDLEVPAKGGRGETGRANRADALLSLARKIKTPVVITAPSSRTCAHGFTLAPESLEQSTVLLADMPSKETTTALKGKKQSRGRGRGRGRGSLGCGVRLYLYFCTVNHCGTPIEHLKLVAVEGRAALSPVFQHALGDHRGCDNRIVLCARVAALTPKPQKGPWPDVKGVLCEFFL